ncbi:hypothetical protein [Prauserella cavernicola]|uniref:Abortive infection protein n=1 Tax=Prauserella cavernicola TaxID=2800127 RepID=A0A934QUP7_9PSEU|nr:hypothetical protein [Prauserella cavernicola]MBK1786678.1 hypothetical protein [Prauserella cavernicola]
MSLAIRGITYRVDDIPAERAERDLRVIKHGLHCDTVVLDGADLDRLLAAAGSALEADLDVWVQPNLADRSHAEVLAHLARAAAGAQRLRAEHPGRVTLVVGCEFSLRLRGMLPGPHELVRLQVLRRWRRFFDRRITRGLDRLLGQAVAVARAAFDGPLTYAAGFWEDVDWSAFDVAGVNLYRFGDDPAAYERLLRDVVAGAGRPLVVTEFGCGAFAGAERRGPNSFLAVNWFTNPPRVRKGHVRDESVQARYLAELIGLFDAEGVHGCFVFTYAMPDFPHDAEARRDLDLAGFGVVKVRPGDPHWEPKDAFHAVARAYEPTGSVP